MLNFFKLTILIVACISFSDISCQSNKQKKQNTDQSNPTITTNDKKIKDTASSTLGEISLKKARILVLSTNKEMKEVVGSENYSKCSSWSLTGKQIELIIKEFEPMTSEGQYLSYSFYQCRISGEIKIDDIKYKYWLGAGATLVLRNGDTTLYYGCLGKKCEKYFISGRLGKEDLQ